MRPRIGTNRLALLIVAMLGVVGCWRTDKHVVLPDKIPVPPQLELTGRDAGWPPRPAKRQNVIEVASTARPAALTDSLESELLNAATQDSQVRATLGEHFAYVMAAELDPDKQRADQASEARAVRLTFYSYSNNVAVEVLMRQRKVEQVNKHENYQPPEGPEEIKTAIALAQREPRLSELVKGMHATAILTYFERGQSEYGHRILHVSFSATEAEEEAPRYYALVDLTEQKTVAAGLVGER